MLTLQHSSTLYLLYHISSCKIRDQIFGLRYFDLMSPIKWMVFQKCIFSSNSLFFLCLIKFQVIRITFKICISFLIRLKDSWWLHIIMFFTLKFFLFCFGALQSFINLNPFIQGLVTQLIWPVHVVIYY